MRMTVFVLCQSCCVIQTQQKEGDEDEAIPILCGNLHRGMDYVCKEISSDITFPIDATLELRLPEDLNVSETQFQIIMQLAGKEMEKKCSARMTTDFILLLPFDIRTFLINILHEHYSQMGETFDEAHFSVEDFDKMFPLLPFMNIQTYQHGFSKKDEEALIKANPDAKIIMVVQLPKPNADNTYRENSRLCFTLTGSSGVGKSTFAKATLGQIPFADVFETDSGKPIPPHMRYEQGVKVAVIGNNPRLTHDANVLQCGSVLYFRDIRVDHQETLTITQMDGLTCEVPLDYTITGGYKTIKYTGKVKSCIRQTLGCGKYFTLMTNDGELNEGDDLALGAEYHMMISDGPPPPPTYDYLGYVKEEVDDGIDCMGHPSGHIQIKLFHQDQDEVWAFEIDYDWGSCSSGYCGSSWVSMKRVQVDDTRVMDNMTRVEPGRFTIQEWIPLRYEELMENGFTWECVCSSNCRCSPQAHRIVSIDRDETVRLLCLGENDDDEYYPQAHFVENTADDCYMDSSNHEEA